MLDTRWYDNQVCGRQHSFSKYVGLFVVHSLKWIHCRAYVWSASFWCDSLLGPEICKSGMPWSTISQGVVSSVFRWIVSKLLLIAWDSVPSCFLHFEFSNFWLYFLWSYLLSWIWCQGFYLLLCSGYIFLKPSEFSLLCLLQ